MKTLFGVALACVASILFNGAVVLQARETRALPQEQGLHLSLLASLLRRRRWLVGIALQLLGMGLQTAALLLAPLTVVQPADAAGLIFLLYLGSRNLGERVGRSEILAVASIVVGIVGLTVAAPWGALVIAATIAAVGGVIGTLSEQSALQQRHATQVAPLIFVVELLVPVGLAVTVVGESWSSSPALIGICLTLVTIGTIALGRTPTIAQLIASGNPPCTPAHPVSQPR
jgi:drug/metabolite transporter (DMT)-like permease